MNQCELQLTFAHIKQHSVNRTTRAQRCFERTPPRHTCVSLLHEVKFCLGSEVGHTAVAPLHVPSLAHSDSRLQLSLAPLYAHCSVQHGPWLGLEGKDRIKGQAPIQCHRRQTPNRKGGNVSRTCTVCRAEVCTFCPPLRWRYSSRGLCTGHCSRSHIALRLPQVHFHILAGQILCTGTNRHEVRRPESESWGKKARQKDRERREEWEREK